MKKLSVYHGHIGYDLLSYEDFTVNEVIRQNIQIHGLTKEMAELKAENKSLKKENAKLKERLENAIVTDFNLNDQVFIVDDEKIKKGKINHIYFDCYHPTVPTRENIIPIYEVAIQFDNYSQNICKNIVFATKKEAKKHIEQVHKLRRRRKWKTM